VAALEPPTTVPRRSSASIQKSSYLPPSMPSVSKPPIVPSLAWPPGTRTPPLPTLRKRAPLLSLFYSSSGYSRPRPTLSNPSTCRCHSRLVIGLSANTHSGSPNPCSPASTHQDYRLRPSPNNLATSPLQSTETLKIAPPTNSWLPSNPPPLGPALNPFPH
jgi:hypothetical protein